MNKTCDGKYVSKNFINTIDDKKFNFDQWVQHQKNIKNMIQSMKPHFDYLVSDGKYVAVGFHVHTIKKDGGEIHVKDMALFVIENSKIIFCDELTRMVKGGPEDEGFAAMS